MPIDTCVECGTPLWSGQPDFMGSHSQSSDCIAGLKALVAELEQRILNLRCEYGAH